MGLPRLLFIVALSTAAVGCNCGGGITASTDALLVSVNQGTFVEFAGTRLTVDFGTRDAGTSDAHSIELWNQGKASTAVEVVQTLSAPFAVREQGPFVLASGARTTLHLDWANVDEGSFATEMKLKTGELDATVSVTGIGVRPVQIIPVKQCDFVTGFITELDFGRVEPGQSSERVMFFQNNGDDGCVLDFEPVLGAFAVVDLAPGSIFDSFQRRATRIRFAPETFGQSYAATLVGTPRGKGQSVSIALRGSSFAECPRFPNDGGCPTLGPETFINTSGELWKRDSSGQLSRVLGFNYVDSDPGTVTDVAISPSGDLFGVAGFIFAIDPTTGLSREVARPAFPMLGLGFLPDGRMIVAGDGLALLDLTTQPAVLTPIPGTAGIATSGDVVALDNDRILWSVLGGDRLVEVRLNAGTVTMVGSIGIPGVYGLSWDAEGLHGFTGDGRELLLNPQTGSVLSAKSLPGAWNGAASRPPQ